MSIQEIPMDQQMALNIERKKLDRKVYQLERDAEERRKFIHDNPEWKKREELIRKNVEAKLKALKP
jgi:CHASE3 domain sensor protein